MNLTPEEKAKILVNKFKYYTRAFNETNGWEDTCYNAKQCALIAIEFAINYSDSHIEYLQQTKTEIEKL
jgi:L-ribulose-5-phosphate 3-epimerase UlaE